MFDCIKVTDSSGELDMLNTIRQTITRMPIETTFTIEDLTWQIDYWFKLELRRRASAPMMSLEQEIHRFVIALSQKVTPGWYLCDMTAPDTYQRVETGEHFAVRYTIEEELAYIFGPDFSFPAERKSLSSHSSATFIHGQIHKGNCKSPNTPFSFVDHSTGQASFYGLFGNMDENDAQFFSEAVSEHFHQSGPTAIELLTEALPPGQQTPNTSLILQRLAEALLPYVITYPFER